MILRIHFVLVAVLAALASTSWGAPATYRGKVVSVSCEQATGLCKATLDATLPSSAGCASSVVAWNGMHSSGLVFGQLFSRSNLERRFVVVGYDGAKCSSVQAGTVFLNYVQLTADLY